MSLPLRLALSAVTLGLIWWFWPFQSEAGYMVLGAVCLANGIFWGAI